MLRILITLFLLFTLPVISYCQDKVIDDKANSIPNTSCTSVDGLSSYISQNFSTETDRVRAIYIWITGHINYDVVRLKSIESNPDQEPQTVADVLNSRKAVCQGYADLFVDLCKGMGINAIMIGGYSKDKGRIAHIAHAWAAASVGDMWYLFDPTWGAGFVKDEKFVRQYNNSFYMVQPANFISDHMPFDPLFQFLNYPLTNREFINGATAGTKDIFQFNDSIQQYNQFSTVQQMTAELRRLVAAGVENDLLLKRRINLKNALQSYSSVDAFEESTKDYNAAVEQYNRYIGYKSKQFTGIGNNDLREMVDSMLNNVKLSRSFLLGAVPKTDEQRQAKASVIGSIERFWVQIKKENVFVEKYIIADDAKRKQLFTRR